MAFAAIVELTESPLMLRLRMIAVERNTSTVEVERRRKAEAGNRQAVWRGVFDKD
jgi:hypothetical protein